MEFIKRRKIEIILSLLIIIVYILPRVLTLTSLPIFTDESIYIRWAQIAKNDASWRFISLTDGKQPLFIWIVMVVMRFFNDPLTAGRFVSLISGLVSLIGLFLLSREIFKSTRIGLLSAFLYAIYPFSLVYDRMALYDSLVGTLSIFGVYLTVLLIKHLKIEYAFLLGVTTGLSVLNKSSGFFILYLLPFSLLILNATRKTLKSKLIRFFLFSLIVIFITYAMYFVLRLSPFFYIIEEKNSVFVYPFNEWIKHPVEFFYSNLKGLTIWFVTYFGPTFLAFVISSFFIKGYLKEKILLLIWFLAPFTALALFGKTIYPRYIFFMTLSLIPLVSFSFLYFFKRAKSNIFKTLLIIFLLSYPLLLSYQILTNFGKSFIPQSDKNQYLLGWPSGIGVKESIEFFKKEALNNKIHIFTGGTFGLLPYAYEIYLIDNKNITISGFWPIQQTINEEIINEAKNKKSFVVMYQDCPPCPKTGIAPPSWPLKEVMKIERGEKNSFFTVYEVRTE